MRNWAPIVAIICQVHVLLAGVQTRLSAAGIVLTDGQVEITILPELGARVSSFRRSDGINIINENPLIPATSASFVDTEEAGRAWALLGQTMWVSPQDSWWSSQNEFPDRKAAHADWPPDPDLDSGPYEIILKKADIAVLRSKTSRYAAVSLTKTFQLIGSGRILVRGEILNRGQVAMRRGVWFNMRVRPTAQEYVPIGNNAVELSGSAESSIISGFHSMKIVGSSERETGKARLWPTKGALYAFFEHDFMQIEFPLTKKVDIAPSHSPVEIYRAMGLRPILELETHGPATWLQRGETVAHEEIWTLTPYRGNMTAADHIRHLERLVAEERAPDNK